MISPKVLTDVEDFAEEIMKASSDPLHGFDHLDRVRQNALNIVKILDLRDEVDLNLLQVICLLHDLPIALTPKFIFGPVGKHLGEKLIVKKKLPSILEKFPFTVSEKKIITIAVVNHAYSIPYIHLNKNGSIYTKVLQDADSLDYFSPERLAALRAERNKGLFYFVGGLISEPYFAFGRAKMRGFLNYPEATNAVNWL